MIGRIFNKLELYFHNECTIEKYFAKQGCLIGKNNRIYIRSLGSEPYLVKIGSDCIIGSGTKFITHDGAVGLFRDEIPDINMFGKIEVGDKTFIGINCIILPNVTIGPNAIVGAGSVVTKDVPEGAVVAGVPARQICTTREYKDRCIKKWQDLNLQGRRQTWEKQLKRHFWGIDEA